MLLESKVCNVICLVGAPRHKVAIDITIEIFLYALEALDLEHMIP